MDHWVKSGYHKNCHIEKSKERKIQYHINTHYFCGTWGFVVKNPELMDKEVIHVVQHLYYSPLLPFYSTWDYILFLKFKKPISELSFFKYVWHSKDYDACSWQMKNVTVSVYTNISVWLHYKWCIVTHNNIHGQRKTVNNSSVTIHWNKTPHGHNKCEMVYGHWSHWCIYSLEKWAFNLLKIFSSPMEMM